MSKKFDSNRLQKRAQTQHILSELIAKAGNTTELRNKALSIPSQDFSPARINQFLDQLADPNPTPAGGSAAAYAGAMAAALITMVARITIANPKYDSVKSKMQEIIIEAESLMNALYLAVGEDDLVYKNYVAARSLSSVAADDQQIRLDKLQKARMQTIQVPLKVAYDCLDVLNLGLLCIQLGSFYAICDSSTASLLAESAFNASLNNALLNLRESEDMDFNARIQEFVKELLARFNINRVEIQDSFFKRSGIPKN